MRISDWSSDVCSSDLAVGGVGGEDGDAVVCCGRMHATSVANEGLRAAAAMRTLRPMPIAPWTFLDSSTRPERQPGLVRPYGVRTTHGPAVAARTPAGGPTQARLARTSAPQRKSGNRARWGKKAL